MPRDTHRKVKKIHYFEIFHQAPRVAAKNYPPIDWKTEFEELALRQHSERVLDKVIYEPRVVDGVPVLGIHRPLNPDFMQYMPADADHTVSIFEALKEAEGPTPAEQVERFVRSTAVAFPLPGKVAVCMSGQDCPRIGALMPFLTKFFPPAVEGFSWNHEPYMTEGDVRRFKEQSAGVRSADLSFTTARDVFAPDSSAGVSLLNMADGLADQLGGDIEVTMTIRLSKGSNRPETRQRMRDAITNDLPRYASNPHGRASIVSTSSSGLDEEELDLMQHRVTHQVEIMESDTEERTFDNLLQAVADHCNRDYHGLD